MRNKPLYLKLLFRGYQPDVKSEELIKEALEEAYIKPIEGTKDKVLDSRNFILKNTEDFLQYAIDYSMYDKFSEYV